MSDANTNPVPETPAIMPSQEVPSVSPDSAKPNGNGKPRVLPNKAAKPLPAKLPDLTKLSSEQLAALVKSARSERTTKLEAERKVRKVRGDGGGTARLLDLVLTDATLTGDKLYAAVSKAGIKSRSGEKLASTTIDTTRYDMAHRLRAVIRKNMTINDIKAWLAKFDSTPRGK